MLEVVVRDGRLADAESLAHGRARGLVAHVRAVGQVVGAEGAHEQLVEEGRLVRGATRGVERRLVGGVERVELGRDDLEGVVPGDGLVVVGSGWLVDRLGETPLHAEPVLALVEQVVDGVLGPEGARNENRRRLPGDRLGAVLAELRDLAVVGVGPGAAHAVEAVLLVQRRQQLHGAGDAQLLDRWLHRVQDAGHARRPALGAPTSRSASVTSSTGGRRLMMRSPRSRARSALAAGAASGAASGAAIRPDAIGPGVDDHALAAQEPDDGDAELRRRGRRRATTAPIRQRASGCRPSRPSA